MDCLDNIIGISRSECECLTADLPEGYTESNSGLYMDELPESPVSLAAIKSIQDCGKDMGAILTQARANAILQFKTDLYKHLALMYKPRANPYTGLIGKKTGSSALNITKAYAGLILAGKSFKGATLQISKVWANFTTDASINLLILKVRRGETDIELLETITIESTASGINENVVDISLPMWDDTGKDINYYLLYASAGLTPKDNPVSCGCGISEYDLHVFLKPKGYLSDTIAPGGQQTNYANGIVLDVDVRCNTQDIICQAYRVNEFIKVAVEWTILRKSVVNLINGVLHSDAITRYTQGKREQMYYDKGSLDKKYNNDVQWIAENMSMGLNDCFICNETSAPFYMGGIMS